MAYGSVNPLLSKRNYNILCRWWDKTTFDGQSSPSQIAYKKQPSGTFYAKTVSDYNFGTNEVADIRFGSQFVAVESPYDLSAIRPDCLVEFEGLLYRVQNKTSRVLRKTTQNMRNPIRVWVLQLVR